MQEQGLREKMYPDFRRMLHGEMVHIVITGVIYIQVGGDNKLICLHLIKIIYMGIS